MGIAVACDASSMSWARGAGGGIAAEEATVAGARDDMLEGAMVPYRCTVVSLDRFVAGDAGTGILDSGSGLLATISK